MGRRSIGIELNPEYEAVIRQRLGQTQTLFQELEFVHNTHTKEMNNRGQE